MNFLTRGQFEHEERPRSGRRRLPARRGATTMGV
jgi:hypothetical protein